MDTATSRSRRRRYGFAWIVALVSFALVSGASSACPSRDVDGALWIFELSGRERARWPPSLPLSAGPDDRITVDSILGDGKGGFFVAGNFQRVAGAACRFFAHIVPPGRLEQKWCLNPNRRVLTIQRRHGRLQLGGRFTRIGGVSRRGAAAFDVETAQPLREITGELEPSSRRTFVVGEKTGKRLRGARWREAARSLDEWAASFTFTSGTPGVYAAVRHKSSVYALLKNTATFCVLARYDVQRRRVTTLVDHVGCAAVGLGISGSRIGVAADIARGG